MKKFYSLLITVLVSVAAMSQSYWTGAISTDWQVAGNWSTNNVPNSNTEIAVFDLGTSLTITNVPNTALGGLIVTNNTTVVISKTGGGTNTLTINNTAAAIDFSITSGSSLELGTGMNITLASGSAGNPTTATIAGTFLINNRTYSTNNTNVFTNVASNGVIEVGTGSVTCTNAARLSFEETSTYIHNRNGGTVPTATWNASSNCNLTGVSSTYPGGMGQTFGNVTFNSTLTADVTINANLTCAGNLTISNSGAAGNDLRLTGNNTNRTVSVGGKFSMVSGLFTIDRNDGGSVLDVAGDFEVSGGTLTEDGSGTASVNFNGTSVQTYTKTGGTISGTLNFTINSGSTVNFGTSVLDGSSGTFVLSSTGKIITANAGGVPSTITVTGATSYNSGADYEFQGASTGVFTTTPTASTVRNLTINNSGGNVTLSQPLAVTGTLGLSNGVLITDATNLITINAGAGTSGSSYVSGPMAKVGTTAFTFPVGKIGSGIRTIGISAPTSSSTFVAEFFRSNPHGLSGTIGAGLTNVSACEYWNLDRLSGGNASVILSWESGSSCSGSSYVGNLITLRVARLNAGTWNNEGRLSTTGTLTSGTITSGAAVTTFNTSFALSSVADDNALPVTFANVKAFAKNSGVQIEWSNLTEKDVILYSVERSADGVNFTAINDQQPKGNNNDKQSYSGFDASPVAGANYYRIKAMDISGKAVYSKSMKVDLNKQLNSFTLYPNPVKGGAVSVSVNVKQGQYTLSVVNTSGQQVYSVRLNLAGGTSTQAITLPSSVKPGVYNMVISGDTYRDSKMFIIQ